MESHKKPDVYIEEVGQLPAPIVDVESAVPAFIGYTQRASRESYGDLVFVPTRIDSLRDFEGWYGNAAAEGITVRARDTGGGFALDGIDGPTEYYPLYDALRLFYDNGGQQCYVVSVGTRATDTLGRRGVATNFVPAVAALTNGVDALAGEIGPTLIVVPEASELPQPDYAAVVTRVLEQCGTLQDRFAIFDLYDGANPKADFKAARDCFDPTLRLSYGAVYYPHLVTALTYPHVESEGEDGLRASNVAVSVDGAVPVDIASIDGKQTPLRDFVLAALRDHHLTLPPSGAIAGVFAATDRSRGVWKAPANVALASVLSPSVAIDSRTAERLGVDSLAGKSINTIRELPGRGTLVWGARTLAGNDDEWRYVSVRRFVTTVEQSVRTSTAWVVFEPNDANTWVKVRGAIENYLTAKWRDSALMGTTPKEAYYVHCGLGTTMTNQDLVDGRLVVEIGMAVTRPAEFIVLRIAHRVAPA